MITEFQQRMYEILPEIRQGVAFNATIISVWAQDKMSHPYGITIWEKITVRTRQFKVSTKNTWFP